MSNEANGGGISRVEALEAVAKAAREYWLNRDASQGLYVALAKLDALPAVPEPARGEVVEVRKIVSMVTGRDADDVCLEYAICTDGTAWLLQWEDCKPIGWKQLPPIPTTRLAMVKGDGAWGMSVEAPVPKDHPLMVAWAARKATQDHANNARWAVVPEHTTGALWGEFVAGWEAATRAEVAALRAERDSAWDTLDQVIGGTARVLNCDRDNEAILEAVTGIQSQNVRLRAELAEMTEAKNAHITFQNHNAKLGQARDDELAALKREVERLVEHAQEVDHDYYGLQSCEDFDVAEAIDTARAALAHKEPGDAK